MIPNRTTLLSILCFVLAGACLGFGTGPEKKPPVIHISKRVKIERPAKEVAQKPQQATEEAAEAAEVEKTVSEAAAPESQEKAVAEKPARTAEKELQSAMLQEQQALYGQKELLYSRKGKVDPFEQFLHRPEPEKAPEEAQIQRRTPQTPLERISLSQLKLTAILRRPAENKTVAMVEDPTGKGYVVSQGTWIGEKGGRVSEILSDRIIIEEKYKDVFGKIAVREIEKKLQKQPGE